MIILKFCNSIIHPTVLCLLFSNTMFLLFLQLQDRNVLIDPNNGPYISTSKKKIRKFCLSFWNSICCCCLLSVVFWHCLCIVAEFLIFETIFGQISNTTLCLKKKSQKWTTFVFGNTNLHQTFTDCISNIYTNLTYH